MFYYLMRKDEPLTVVNISDDGSMLSYSPNIRNRELAPLQDSYKPTWLRDWWASRSIPLGQDKIEHFLQSRGYRLPSEYLVKNLGLSLTDYYWIKPIESDLTWETVNLYDNDFKENLLLARDSADQREEDDSSGVPHYSPNSSLQGQIEKTWVILNGKRCLMKGNHTNLSVESLNEVIAAAIHQSQNYDNYTNYELIRIKGKEYDYGCYCKAFTSQKVELISAWAIFSSEKEKKGVSPFMHFLNRCKALGMDTEQLQSDLDYQILTDFLMSGHDRHLNNIAVVRDADSLKFLRMAPIFDSGGAFFAGKAKPRTDKDFLKIKTNGFASTEMSMLKLVKNRDIVDLTKLPPASKIREIYAMDSQLSEREIKDVGYWYEKKIDLCRAFQLGRDLLKWQYTL